MFKLVGKKNKVADILAIAFGIIAFLIIIFGMNSKHTLTVGKIKLESSGIIESDGAGFILSTNDNQALLFVNDKNEVVEYLDIKNSKNSAHIVTGLATVRGRNFVIGAERYSKGAYYNKESVAEYTSDGKLIKVLYTENHEEDDYVITSTFSDVYVTDQGRVLLEVNREDRADILDITDGEGKVIHSVHTPGQMYYAWFKDADHVLMSDRVGSYYTYELGGELVDTSMEEYEACLDEMYGISSLASKFKINEIAPFPQYYCICRDEANGREYLCYSTDAEMWFYDFDSQKSVPVTELDKSLRMTVFDILYYASILYLILAALYLLYILLKNEKSIKEIWRILLVLLVFGGVCAFYTYQSYQVLSKEYDERLVSQTKQLEYIVTNHYADVIEEMSQVGFLDYCDNPSTEEKFLRMDREFTDFTRANGTDYCTFTGLEIKYDGNYNFVVVSNDPSSRGEFSLDAEEFESIYCNMPQYNLTELYSYGEKYQVCSSVIRLNSEEPVAFLYVAYNTEHLKYLQWDRGLRMFLSLLVIATILYIGYKALADFRESIISYREARKASGRNLRIPLYGGVAAFLVTAVCQFDSVIIVFTVRELCSTLSNLEAAKMAALPISLYALGIMLGSALPSVISRKINERISTVSFCLIGVISMAMAVYSVTCKDIYLFTAAKVIEGISIGGAAYSVIFAAPFSCEDKDVQQKLVNSTQTSAVAAGAIGVFAGGYVAEYLSHKTIFTIKGIMCVMLAVVCLLMFKDSKLTKTDAAESKSLRSYLRGSGWGFYFKPKAVLLYLCCIFPLILFNGYRSYLYPIYSQNAGISATMLSDIFLLSRAVVFFASDTMNLITQKFKAQKIMIVSVLICSASLVCFIATPTFTWAVVTLFVINIFMRSGTTAGIFCQSELCDELGYDKKEVSLCSETIKGIFSSLSSPVMSLFLAFGDSYACAIVGLICLALSLIYLFLMPRSHFFPGGVKIVK